MARVSAPNPLIMKFSFPTAARRRKNSLRKSEGQVVDPAARKVSIDHTFLSGDDHSHLMAASEDFSRSFDAEGHVEIYPSNFARNGPASEEQYRIAHDSAPSGMRASMSEPSFLANQIDHNCQGQGCSCMNLSQSQRSANSHPSGPMPQQQQQQPPAQLPNPQQASSPKAEDPALRARIEAIRIQQQLLGDNHPDVIFALSSLAKLYQRRGHHAEAASILGEARMRSTLSNSTPQFSSFGNNNPQQGNVPTEISFGH